MANEMAYRGGSVSQTLQAIKDGLVPRYNEKGEIVFNCPFCDGEHPEKHSHGKFTPVRPVLPTEVTFTVDGKERIDPSQLQSQTVWGTEDKTSGRTVPIIPPPKREPDKKYDWWDFFRLLFCCCLYILCIASMVQAVISTKYDMVGALFYLFYSFFFYYVASDNEKKYESE
jgi:hypothetical protein